MGNIKNAILNNNRIYLSTRLSPNDHRQFLFDINKIPGRQFHKVNNKWSVPLNYYTAGKVIDWEFKPSKDLYKWIRKNSKDIQTDKKILNWNAIETGNWKEIETPPDGIGQKLKQAIRPELKQTEIETDNPIKIETTGLFPFQVEGIRMLEKLNGRALLADEMRLGKEQPISEPVLTPYGWTTIGELKLGDYVIGSSGKKITVTGIFPQGEKDVYEITFSDRVKVRCGIEHLWTVRDGNMVKRKSGWQTLSLNEMLKRKISYKDGNYKFEIPKIINPIEFETENNLPIDPYVLGAIIANGSTVRTPVTITVNENDIDVMNRIGGEWRLKSGCKVTSIKGIAAIIRELKLDVLSRNKFIPDCYKYASIDDRKNLLYGLMDGDGSNQKNRNVYHTTSEKLAYDVADLVRSLAGIAIVRKYIRNDGKPDDFQVNVKMPFCPFFSIRKSNGWKFDRRIIGNKIIDVQKIGKEESVCIMVDSPDHLYITAGYKLTHNTAQSIHYLKNHPELRPAVIVVPASVKINWERELRKWGVKERTRIISGRNGNCSSEDQITIINYDILGNHTFHLENLRPKLIIADESHMLKNPHAQRTKALKYIAKGVKHIICISGTPIVNRPSEFYTTLNLLAPEMFNNHQRYLEEYCNAKRDSSGKGASNVDRLYKILSSTIMIRRLRKDVIADLPEKTRDIIPMPLTNRHEYEEAEDDIIEYIRTHDGDGAARKAMFAETVVKFEKLRQLCIKGKFEAIKEWIDNFIESGEKLVVFCVHRIVVDELREHYKDQCVTLYGGDSIQKRQIAIDRFNEDPKCRLFVGNIIAAGQGIPLAAADNTCFIELSFVPGHHDQAEDRVINMQKKNPTCAYYLVGLNTIEERIASIIDKKRIVLSQILDGETPAEESLISILIDYYKSGKKIT